MDPLSVGASAIAIVGAIGKVIKGIDRLKALQEAPRELDDLLAEMSQFELVLQAIQDASEHPDPGLKILLDTAKRVLVDFDSLIEYELTQARTSNKADRWQWTRSSKDIKRLRRQLRDVRGNLVALVGLNTKYAQHPIFCDFVETLYSLLSLLESQNLHLISHVAYQLLHEHRQSSNQITSAITHLEQLLGGSPSARAALTGPLAKLPHLSLEPAPKADSTVANRTETKVPRPSLSVSKPHPERRFGNLQQFSPCDASCVCKCHVYRRLGALGNLSSLFGQGFIQTAACPIPKFLCDTDLCRAQAAPFVYMQYCLPKWLASRMVLIWLAPTWAPSPELLLRVPRVVERSNEAFRAIRFGGVEDLKTAITTGDCTPYDVDEYGDTLLTV